MEYSGFVAADFLCKQDYDHTLFCRTKCALHMDLHARVVQTEKASCFSASPRYEKGSDGIFDTMRNAAVS